MSIMSNQYDFNCDENLLMLCKVLLNNTSLSYLALTSLFLAHLPVFLCLNVCLSKALVFSSASNFFKASSGLVFCNSSNSLSCCFSFSFLSILQYSACKNEDCPLLN